MSLVTRDCKCYRFGFVDSNNQKVYPPLEAHHGQQQQGFYPQQPPQYNSNPVVITQQPSTVVIHAPQYGNDPQATTCPSCRAAITTSVKYEPGTKTHLFAGLCCLLGCMFGCCLIPYCTNSCQNANHSCPNCGTYLGTGHS